MTGTTHRPAGIAYEAGGFTTKIAPPTPGMLATFVRSTFGKYWSTLAPAAFATANASAASPTTGKKVGYAGVHLDTERHQDQGFAPGDVLKITAGNGQIVSGPYNVQPSWGVGCEYLLNPGQNLNLHLDNALIVGDGSTKKLKLAAPIDWNGSN
jgi:hypothetical protein